MTGSRHTWVIQNRPIRIENQDWHQTSTGTFHWASHCVCNVKIKMIAVPVISCSSQNQSITKYIQFEYPYYTSIHIIQEPWPITDWEDHVWKIVSVWQQQQMAQQQPSSYYTPWDPESNWLTFQHWLISFTEIPGVNHNHRYVTTRWLHLNMRYPLTWVWCTAFTHYTLMAQVESTRINSLILEEY